MTNDTFYDLKKARLTYRSNNPSVVSDDKNVEDTASGVGVSTVFSYETINGKTVSNN